MPAFAWQTAASQTASPAEIRKSEIDAPDWARCPGASARVFPSEQMVRLVCRAVPAERRGALTALDIGCGNGRNSAALAALGFGRVTAVDPNQELLAAAAQTARAAGCRIETRAGGFPNLPFETAFADLAVCWGVLFVLGGPEATTAALRELARVLKPGGVLIADWRTDADDLINHVEERVAKKTFRLDSTAPAGLQGTVYSFWRAEEVRALHAEAGFEIAALQRQEIWDVSGKVRYSWWQTCARRCGI